jgi:hypothetical protein
MTLDFTKPLGSGTFTFAFEQPNQKVLLLSNDPIKGLIADGKIFPKHRMFNPIKRVNLDKVTKILVPESDDDEYGILDIVEGNKIIIDPSSFFFDYSLYLTSYVEMLDTTNNLDFSQVNERQARLYMELSKLTTCDAIDGINMLANDFPCEFYNEVRILLDVCRNLLHHVGNFVFDTNDFNFGVRNKQLVLIDPFFPDSDF